MRVHDRGSILEVDDVPVLHWLFCLLFLGVGGIFVLGPLGLFPDADQLRWWLRILIAAVGSIAVGVGVWQLLDSPRSRLSLNRVNRRVRLERVGLRGRTSSELPFDAIAAVELFERTDDEGNPIFQLRVFPRDAGPITLSPIWTHGREHLEEVARTISTTLGVEAVNVRPPQSARIVARS